MEPKRKILPHGIPPWVRDGSEYFVTICTEPRGENQLCRDGIADFLKESLLFYQTQGELWVHLLLLMPDHLHGILGFSPSVGVKQSVSKWKHYTVWEKGFAGSAIFLTTGCGRTKVLWKKRITSV
ncbi:MAG: hypothetical protein K9M45_02195 [Kiritimatiellales bacterium]|nr:hypothetical protein [Kiritimatiellales bacterium]